MLRVCGFLIVGLAILVSVQRIMVPNRDAVLQRQLRDHFRDIAESLPDTDTTSRTAPVYRSVLTQAPVRQPPTAARNDACSMEAYGPGAEASLYDRVNWRILTAVVSFQNWLSSGQGPFRKSEFQRTVDRLGGVPCFPASPDARAAMR